MSTKKIFYKFDQYIIWIIGIFLLVIPFSWYGNDTTVIGNEIYTLLNPSVLFLRNFSAWDYSFGFGVPNIHIIDLPYSLLNIFLSAFLSTSLLQRFLFGLCFSLSFLSFYTFLSYIFKDNSDYKYYYIFTALFYAFNPFSLAMFPWFSTYSFLFIILPFFLKEISVYLRGGKNVIYLFILSFLLSSIASNVALFGIALFMVITFVLVEALSIKGSLYKVMIILAILIISNLYWVLPLSKMYVSMFSRGRLYSSVLTEKSIFKFPIFDALTLNEYYFFDLKDDDGNLYYNYAPYYKPFSRLIVLILLVVICWALVSRKYITTEVLTNKWYISYSLFLLLLGIFLTKGTAPPFGNLYYFLLTNIRLFQVYRASDLKFPYLVLFAIALLFCWSLIQLHTLTSIKWRTLKIIFLGITTLFIMLPFLNGSIFRDDFKVTVPDYWYDLSKHINTNNNFGRILLYPSNMSSFDSFKWGYFGGWFTTSILNVSTIGYTKGYGPSAQEGNFKEIAALYDTLNATANISTIQGIAHKYNITHLLYRDDLVISDTNYLTKHTLDKLFTNKTSFNKLTLYEITNKSQPFIINSSSELKFNKISPSKYEVSFEVPKNGYISLEFLESFDPNWVISTGTEFLDIPHYMAYNYANAWDIKVEDLCIQHSFMCEDTYKGTYKVTAFVIFYPQHLFEVGIKLYIYTFSAYLVYISMMTTYEYYIKWRFSRKVLQ